MKGKISCIDQIHIQTPGFKHVFFCCKVGRFNMGRYRFDSLLTTASSGQSTSCSLTHFRVGFKRKTERLPLGAHSHLTCSPVETGLAARARSRHGESFLVVTDGRIYMTHYKLALAYLFCYRYSAKKKRGGKRWIKTEVK